ncbi:hypothetical protein MHU86_11755 [Fragilaria crotonensis]|nr:hypothetical protein MHU86_11755 [Fragilaria crotonensis]
MYTLGEKILHYLGGHICQHHWTAIKAVIVFKAGVTVSKLPPDEQVRKDFDYLPQQYQLQRTGERDVAIHFPQQFTRPDGTTGSSTFYDCKPDWFSATIPRMAAPTDITGHQIFHASSSTVSFPLQAAPSKSFQEWIQQLPEAEQSLISTVSLAMCDAEHLLLQYLQIACTIQIGTVGENKHHRGAFSWIICAPGREHLVLNTGTVDGWQKCQNSLRSEITAIASVTLYLTELAKFHSLTIQSKLKLFVNSSSAIREVSNVRDMIPKRKMANNADLLSMLRDAPSVIRHFHLSKRHRHNDADTIAVELRPFSAQLNDLCTSMATSHLARFPTRQAENTPSRYICPRSLPVAVFFRSHHVSSNYIPIIRDEITSRRHRAFLQKKYKWNDDITATVAWEAFSLCGHRVRNDKAPTRSKLVHNWLNVGAQRAKHGTVESVTLRACPYCALPEDFVHLLSCRSPKAMTSRYDAVIVLKKALGESAGNISIFRAITQWTLHPTVTPTLPSGVPSLQTSINRAVQSQTDIGWLNLFRGIISAEWGNVTTEDSSSPMSRGVHSTAAVHHLAGTIRALQDYSIAIWKSRNEVLHQNAELSNDILRAQLHHEITTMYSLQNTFSPILQSYFAKPLEDQLLCQMRQKQRWLRLVRLATSHATSKGSRQQVMSSYFPHATNIPENVQLATVPMETMPRIQSASHQVPILQYFPPIVRATTPTTD